MSGRWTMHELDAYSDIEFAIAILNERNAKLNQYAPLSNKIDKSIKKLKKLLPVERKIDEEAAQVDDVVAFISKIGNRGDTNKKKKQ
jgi:hypothetical protein